MNQPAYIRRRSDRDTPAYFFIKAFCFFTLGLILAIGLLGCDARTLPTQPQSAAAVEPTEVPRAPVIVPTPPRPRPTPIVIDRSV